MCAAALRQLGPLTASATAGRGGRAVLTWSRWKAGVRWCYYGCRNDRFGGCGSVLPVHAQYVVPRPLCLHLAGF
jgi:hypothetical protein